MNQLMDTGYAYDADGNMTTWTANGVTYTAYFDAENRLYKVTYSSGGSHTYYFYYSPDGLVAKQTVDGTETRFVQSGYLCLQERNSSNTVTNAYVWDPRAPGGIGGLLELKQSGAYYSYMYDGRGNVSVLFDGNNQAVKNSYKYDPFGVRLYASETITQPYQFSTKYYYPGFGGNNHGVRFYLTSLGRWLTHDPMGEAGGLNLYGFVGNNAINKIDENGYAASDVPATGPVNGNESYPSGNNKGTTAASVPDAARNWGNICILMKFSDDTNEHPTKYQDCKKCHYKEDRNQSCFNCHHAPSDQCRDCHKNASEFFLKQGTPYKEKVKEIGYGY